MLLVISLSAFAYSSKQALDYWDFQTQLVDVETLILQKITPEQLSEKIGNAINEDRLEDAKVYLAIGRLYQYPLHYDYYSSYIQQRDTELRKFKKSVTGFSSGFLSGKGENTSGISGAIVSDLTVVGDARDLYQQYQLYNKGEDVNQLIVGLAGVGIGLTAATYGTAGTTLTVKAGTSVFKLAAKTGRLTKGFSVELLRMSKNIFDWRLFRQSIKQSNKLSDVRRVAQQSFHPRALRPLQSVAKSTNIIRVNTSLADTLHMLRYVENSDDLRRLEKFSLKHKHLSKGMLSLLGRGALRSVRVLKRTTQLLMSLLGVIVSALFSLLFLFSRKRQRN